MWDWIVAKHPRAEAEEDMVEDVAPELEEDDNDDYGLAFLYDEEPESQESRILGWGQAANDPRHLQALQPTQPASQALEPSQSTFNVSWKRKEGGQVLEKVRSQIASSDRPPHDKTPDDLLDMDIDLFDDDDADRRRCRQSSHIVSSQGSHDNFDLD